jgi:hypothetical protein
MAAMAHERLGVTLDRVLIGHVFVGIVIELEFSHIYGAVLLII